MYVVLSLLAANLMFFVLSASILFFFCATDSYLSLRFCLRQLPCSGQSQQLSLRRRSFCTKNAMAMAMIMSTIAHSTTALIFSQICFRVSFSAVPGWCRPDIARTAAGIGSPMRTCCSRMRYVLLPHVLGRIRDRAPVRVL